MGIPERGVTQGERENPRDGRRREGCRSGGRRSGVE